MLQIGNSFLQNASFIAHALTEIVKYFKTIQKDVL